jgi:hypothetical protein
VDRYDIECVPDAFKSDKLGYIKDSSIPKNCSRFLKVILSFLSFCSVLGGKEMTEVLKTLREYWWTLNPFSLLRFILGHLCL